MTHRFDVTMQEADRVDALYGLQDLAPQTQGGADAEGSPSHTPPQVSQVTTLREHMYQLAKTPGPLSVLINKSQKTENTHLSSSLFEATHSNWKKKVYFQEK